MTIYALRYETDPEQAVRDAWQAAVIEVTRHGRSHHWKFDALGIAVKLLHARDVGELPLADGKRLFYCDFGDVDALTITFRVEGNHISRTRFESFAEACDREAPGHA